MTSLPFYQKLFFITALCAVVLILPAALADEAEKPVSLLDSEEPINHVKDTVQYVRSKRFAFLSELAKARKGTNWCLDQITDSEASTGVGLLGDVDKCCREHVKCTALEKDYLLEEFPTKKDDIEDEIFRSCACDEEFADCLQDLYWFKCKAKKIGNYYFKRLARRCMNNKAEKERNLHFSIDTSRSFCLWS